MTTLKNFLINKVSRNFFDYAKDMTLEQFYHNCERGDKIIYLFTKTNPSNIKELVLTAAHYTNACRHLLKDERSLRAIDAAFNFESYSKEELKNIEEAAGVAARAVAWDAARNAARAAVLTDAYAAARDAATRAAASHAASAAFYLAIYVVYAAAIEKARAARTTAYVEYADAWTGAIYAADALNDKKLIADIVRKHLPLELWNQEIINN